MFERRARSRSRPATTCGSSATRRRRTWSWRFGGHHVSIHHVVVDGEVRASHAVLPRGGPGLVAAARPAPAAPAGRRRGPRPRPGPLARRRASGTAAVLVAGRAGRHRRRQPALASPTVTCRSRSRTSGGGASAARSGEAWRRIHERRPRSAGLRPEHLEALRLTFTAGRPRAWRPRRSAPTSRSCCGRCSTSTSAGCPTSWPTPRRRSTPATGCDALRFAWAGGIEPGQPHYYRVQGPRLLVEYDNTQRDVNHVHAVWRDPEGDFGDDVLGRHHREEHGALRRPWPWPCLPWPWPCPLAGRGGRRRRGDRLASAAVASAVRRGQAVPDGEHPLHQRACPARHHLGRLTVARG